MQNYIKNIFRQRCNIFKKDKWCGKVEQNILWLLGGVLLAILMIASLLSFNNEIINVIKVLGSLMLVFSIGIAANQFRLNRKQFEKNNEWNTKQFGITETHQSRRIIKNAINELIKDLDVIERKKPFEVFEIHNAFGVFLTDGRFVFHGEQSDKDMRLLPESRNDEHICRFKKNTDGRQVKNILLDLLGEYEYIALGVNNKTFHKESVLSLVAGPIRRNYYLYHKYIKHLQYHHKYGKSVFSEFRKLGIELSWKKRKNERLKNANE